MLLEIRIPEILRVMLLADREADFRRDDEGNWLETQRTDASTKLRFAEQRNTSSEVLLYDDLRDLYLRFDITGKRLYFRRGSGAWVPFYKIEQVTPN